MSTMYSGYERDMFVCDDTKITVLYTRECPNLGASCFHLSDPLLERGELDRLRGLCGLCWLRDRRELQRRIAREAERAAEELGVFVVVGADAEYVVIAKNRLFT